MSQKTGYLGPEGSYSQAAASALGLDGALPYPSFYALFRALASGELDGIVLPIENSLNGGVMQNLDLMQEAEGIIAVREVNIKIEHRLVTLEGAREEDITTIYSHPQALGQCAKYLYSHFPLARQIQTASTSACVDMIKSRSDAGIVSSHFSRGGYVLHPDCISDEKLNFTQFLYVVRGAPDFGRPSKKIFLSFVCAHRPGALNAALSVFARDGVNMTKIESRPIKDRVGEYRFFIEAEADISSPKTSAALSSLKDMCRSIKILGCY